MFQWLRTKKSMMEEIKSLRNRLSISETQIRLGQRKLDSCNAELAVFKRIRKETPPLPVRKVTPAPAKVDHAPKQAPRQSSYVPPPTRSYDDERRAGRDSDPVDALTNVALGVGAALLVDSLFSSSSSDSSCSAPSVESGGGGDFGGGGASGSWDD